VARFYLGTHKPHFLPLTEVPLFVSRRTLARRRSLPIASGPWALDSGGFTELTLYGRFTITEADYAREVERFSDAIGVPDFVAPLDWMCEPTIRARTGLSVFEHLERTVASFVRLRELVGELAAPVIQGWTLDDYLRCVELYDRAGVELNAFERVGVGSICRRGQDDEIERIVRRLGDDTDARLHAFGVKGEAFVRCYDALTSADSLAWSYRARLSPPLPGCAHRSCANCLRFALNWRAELLAAVDRRSVQLRLELAV
jgi:hypothetical protein